MYETHSFEEVTDYHMRNLKATIASYARIA